MWQCSSQPPYTTYATTADFLELCEHYCTWPVVSKLVSRSATPWGIRTSLIRAVFRLQPMLLNCPSKQTQMLPLQTWYSPQHRSPLSFTTYPVSQIPAPPSPQPQGAAVPSPSNSPPANRTRKAAKRCCEVVLLR
jgi:hypothetical protein